MATAPDGTLWVAWQEKDADTGRYEIYCSQRSGDVWSLPGNVSATPNVHSTGATLRITPDGAVHITWQEGTSTAAEIEASSQTGGGWLTPRNVSQSASIQSDDCTASICPF